jgi:iron complex outermembrane receptor protein/vitamin B12 transporter
MNNDQILAINTLISEGLAICIVKDSKVIYKSTDKGIYPMYDAAYISKVDLEGCCIADKVIGKAAIMISHEFKVSKVHGLLVSENAISYALANDISLSYERSTPYIKNREKNGMCPVETIATNSNDYSEFIIKVGEFLRNLSLIEE